MLGVSFYSLTVSEQVFLRFTFVCYLYRNVSRFKECQLNIFYFDSPNKEYRTTNGPSNAQSIKPTKCKSVVCFFIS